MKRLVSLAAMLVMAASMSFAAEWTGYLADAKCAAAGKATSEGHAKCAAGCVKGGEKIALVTEDGKVYAIANQDSVAEHVGHKVTVSGKAEGTTISVDKVTM